MPSLEHQCRYCNEFFVKNQYNPSCPECGCEDCLTWEIREREVETEIEEQDEE